LDSQLDWDLILLTLTDEGEGDIVDGQLQRGFYTAAYGKLGDEFQRIVRNRFVHRQVAINVSDMLLLSENILQLMKVEVEMRQFLFT